MEIHPESYESLVMGMAIIRIGIGLIFAIFGFEKLKKGRKEWQWLGEQMKNLGICFAPLFWGICAASTEFFGGFCLIFGLFIKEASALLSFVMFVAIVHHIKNGDNYHKIFYPLTYLVVFTGLIRVHN